jgi:hypothetical protein
MADSKEKPVMTTQQAIAPESRKWGRIKDATRLTGVNRTRLYELIRDNRIESFVFKSHAGAVSGARMINLESLTAFLDAEALKAKEAQ